MKTVILIGAQGKMGQAALSGLGKHKVITASRSGEGCDFQVDITSRESIERLYQNVGSFDAVVNTAGYCEYAPFGEMSDEQWQTTIQSKLMGQINLVNIGLNYINQGAPSP